MSTQGENVTDGDIERAYEVLRETPSLRSRETAKRVAVALAEEREKARAPFLALAEELDAEAQGRWVRVLQARESGGRDTEFGERGAGDALHDAALRIRRAAEVTE